ncbi:GAF domain-containing protein [Halobacillus litoralis]|uniref:GAF domain-containing protein n=1 Tax=Halobacillus litoralis TaxID=45668 RepID=UPI001CFD52F4|nr:GAF domain-containing protein [Halobacillus litoralis]
MAQTLEEMVREMSISFDASLIAIAEYIPASMNIVWTFADQPLNDKYTRMYISYGKGVAGKVIQTGAPFLCNDVETLPNPLHEYPIVLAEKLKAFAALPVPTSNVLGAVLLIGYRQPHPLPSSMEYRHHVQNLMKYLKEREVI